MDENASVVKTKSRRDNSLLKRKIKLNVFCYLMMLPAICGFLLWYVYVNFNSIIMAFKVEQPDGSFVFGFENFSYFFTEIGMPDSIFRTALKNTLFFFIITFIITMPTQLLCTYFIYKKILGYKIFRFVFYLPAIIIGSVTGLIFKKIVALDGPVDQILMSLFGTNIPDILGDSNYANWTLLWYSYFYCVGGGLVLFSGAFNSVSQEMLEAGMIDGVGWVRELVQLIVPSIWPTISTMLMLSIMGVFSAGGNVLLLSAQNEKTWTLSYWLYQCVLNGAELEMSSAVGLLITLFTIPIVVVTRKLFNYFDRKVGV